MDRINFIFRQLLNARRNSAIQFDDAGNNTLSSGQVYWELLNQLQDCLNAYLAAFKMKVRIVIKKNIVQIEFFAPGASSEIPYATFKFAPYEDLSDTNKQSFARIGYYSAIITKLKFHINNQPQLFGVLDNLFYTVQKEEADNSPLTKEVEKWRGKIKHI